MAAPTVASIVLVRFPFSDLTASKLRPAVVLADADRGDWVLCQVTSQRFTDDRAVEIGVTDFDSGSIQRISYARPAKLFTANSGIIVRVVGTLSKERFEEIRASVIAVLSR